MTIITFPEGIAVIVSGVLLLLSGYSFGRLSK
ncbi:hypothetical protein GGGNBK_18560 [Sporosarcina sp. ANT_H38]